MSSSYKKKRAAFEDKLSPNAARFLGKSKNQSYAKKVLSCTIVLRIEPYQCSYFEPFFAEKIRISQPKVLHARVLYGKGTNISNRS